MVENLNRAARRRQKKQAGKSGAGFRNGLTPYIQQALDLAVQHHSAGRLSDAEGIYRQILTAYPNQPVALRLLGTLAFQLGKNDIAVDLISKALAIDPDDAEAHNNLGITLHALGKLDEAIASYHQALAIQNDRAEVHSNLGKALRGRGRLNDAIASFRQALANLVSSGISFPINRAAFD